MKSLFKSALLAIAVAGMALASAAQAAVTTVKQTAAAVCIAVAEKVDTFAFDLQVRLGLIATLVTFADPYTGKYPILLLPDDSDADYIAIPFTWPAVAPAINDIIALCKVPAGVKIVDWKFIFGDSDSNGAPTLAASFGSLNSTSAPTALTTTYKAAMTGPGTGTIERAVTSAAFIESSAAERPLGLLVTAVAATYVPSQPGYLVLQLSDA